MDGLRSAPRLTLRDLSGRPITTNSALWPTLLALFHTGCTTSRLAAPFLERFHQAYSSGGARVVAVSQDPAEETSQFAAESGWTMSVLLDSDGAVSRAFQLEAVPTLYWIDRGGLVRSRLVGFQASKYNELSARIASEVGMVAVEIVSPADGVPDLRPG